MRRGERYTTSLPAPIVTPERVFRDHLHTLGRWRRIVLRLVAAMSGIGVERLVRKQLLRALKAEVTTAYPQLLRRNTDELTSRFFATIAALERSRSRLARLVGKIEIDGERLARLLANSDPHLDRLLQRETAITERAERDESLDRDDVEVLAALQAEQRLDTHFVRIEAAIEPVWLGLRTLSVTVGHDLAPFIAAARAGSTAPRTLRQPLAQLLQVLTAFERDVGDDTLRAIGCGTHPEECVRIAGEIRAAADALPLLNLTRIAWEDPLLVVPPARIERDWWPDLRAAWIVAARRRATAELFELRRRTLHELVATCYPPGGEALAWLPTLPHTVGLVLAAVGHTRFAAARAEATRVVIDGQFDDLAVRNGLHQAVLELDQAVERLRTMVDGLDGRGTIGEELRRARGHSSVADTTANRMYTLIERQRARLTAVLTQLESGLRATALQLAQIRGSNAVTFRRSPPIVVDLAEQIESGWVLLARHASALRTIEAQTPSERG